MKSRILSLITLSALVVPMFGMSPEDALSVYIGTRQTSPVRNNVREKSVYTLAMRGDNDATYLYNSASGFIILDSESAGLIGYGDAPVDTANLSPSMIAVLRGYAASPLAASVEMPEHENIPVQLTCKWDQDTPYNDDCPMFNGARSVTGCMATAIAQVLYHPLNRMQGSGKYDYFWSFGQGRISFDYDAHPFAYDLMLDTYDRNSPEESQAAIANLMYAVGVSTSMNYNSVMSGTGDCAGGAGLIRNLGCDKSLRVENRDFYTDTEWDEMIYGQLSTGRPMVYTGVSKDGGHAFVCDGYQRLDGRNYYHINWGWSGNGDGFFELARLAPSYLGIGGGSSTDGFSLLQAALINIKPDEGTPSAQVDFWQYGTLKPLTYTTTRRGRVDMSFEGNAQYGGGGVLSGCLEDIYAVIGFKYINVEDGSEEYVQLSQPMFFNVGSGFDEFTMPCQLFPDKDGTYICKLAFKVDDQWHDVHEELASLGDLAVTLEGNQVSFTFTDKGQRLRADFIDFPGYVVKDAVTKLTVEFLAGKEDVDTEVIPTIITAAGKVLWKQSAQHLELPYGESAVLEWEEPFTPATRRGSYMLTLQDEEGNNLIDPFKINVVTDSGVDSVDADGRSEEVWYTIDGIRIEEKSPSDGIVIRRKGGKTEKVIIR